MVDNNADLLALARARKEELTKELKELDEYINLSEKLLAKLSPTLGDASRLVRRLNITRPAEKQGGGDMFGAAKEQKTSTDIVVDATAKLLIEVKEPMKPAEILPILTSRGVTVGGKNPNNNLSAILSNHRDHGFVSTPTGWTYVGNSGEL